MVANIQAMFSARNRVPWHKMGEIVQECLSANEAIIKAGLNWTASKRALQDTLGNPVTDNFGIFRDDNNVCLGVVGNNYTITQNAYAFDICDRLLQASGAHYETAGALGKGERIWVCANLGAAWKLPGTDDLWERFLLYTTGHDGNFENLLKLVKTRVVCQNTLARAINESGAEVRAKHTKGAIQKLDRNVRLLGKLDQTEQGMSDALTELAKRQIQKASLHEIIDRLYPAKKKEDGSEERTTRTSNTVIEVIDLFESNDRDAIPEIRGSAYNLLNAIIEHSDHFSHIRNTGKQGKYSDEALRTINGIWGFQADKKNDAMEVIMEATQGAPESAYARMLSRHSVLQTTQENGGSRPSLLDTIISQ